MPTRLFTAVALLLMAAGCGGARRIEVSNDSGSAITDVAISAAGIEFAWESIAPGEVVSERITVPLTGRMIVGYTSGTCVYSDTLLIPEGCGNATSVSVWISGDATSIKYDI